MKKRKIEESLCHLVFWRVVNELLLKAIKKDADIGILNRIL